MYSYSYILGTLISIEEGSSGSMRVKIRHGINGNIIPIMITNELYEIIKDVVNVGDKIGVPCYAEPSALDPDSVTIWGKNVTVDTPLCTVSGREPDAEGEEV